MKSSTSLCLLLLSLVLGSCSSTKKTADNPLFGSVWELEYLSGPRIAFSGLYPNRKPLIRFDQEKSHVVGNNSCNGYSADFTLDGKQISFGEPGPTTMMFCGQGEGFFVNTMKKINAYHIDADGKLELLMDEVPMMRFKPKEDASATDQR
ncbi:META domain-containing protein [Zobellia galactanivorans]|uniref:META domain-containing protein n=1 Tax=Zobellia galactanivorans (strain DSM 12802 / CCUG 47099 / CIP 106680 / NCIMB 13871 / Dsij) TaxID=63186 RepID=UPI001C06C297|nr:META domain-containing protein [Zobellia galactanivorans]MBU3025823.1 META domain-containing protein [Zobellia galactanivorans]